MKIINLFLILTLIMSCGSRKTEKTNAESKSERKTEKVESEHQVKNTTKNVKDSVFIERKTEVTQEYKNQKQRQKTSKKKEYYENGNLKQETEIYTTESDQVDILKIENENLTSQSAKLQNENTSLQQEKALYIQEIEALHKKLKEKQTSRTAYSWYWWVLGSVIVWESIKRLLRWIIKRYLKV